MFDLTFTDVRHKLVAVFGALLLSGLCLTAAGGSDAAAAFAPMLI